MNNELPVRLPTCLSRALCFIPPFAGFVVLSDLQPISGWLLSHHGFSFQRTMAAL
jgi:hypothetical protein